MYCGVRVRYVAGRGKELEKLEDLKIRGSGETLKRGKGQERRGVEQAAWTASGKILHLFLGRNIE